MSDTLTPQAAVRAFAFGNPAPATPATAAPAPTTPTTPAVPPAPLVEPHSHAAISPSQAAQMIEWEKENLAKGTITPEEAAKRFDALGATAEQRAPDTRSPDVKQLDEHFPPAKESDFIIPYFTPGQAPPVMPKELQQFDTSARAWLSGAEFPRDLGNSLITTIAKVAQQTKAMTPEQLESYVLLENEKLDRAYGPALEEKLRAAAVMIHALDQKQPGLKNLLKSKGIGDNALVVAQIIGQSERWHARRTGR